MSNSLKHQIIKSIADCEPKSAMMLMEVLWDAATEKSSISAIETAYIAMAEGMYKKDNYSAGIIAIKLIRGL